MSEKHSYSVIIDGMHCANCAQSISKVLERSGAEHISVDPVTRKASFTLPHEMPLTALNRKFQQLGYSIASSSEKRRVIPLDLVVILLLTIPLVITMFWHHPVLADPVIQCLLATPVFVIGWLRLGRSAIGSLVEKAPSMDVLILLGASAAYIQSIIELLTHGHTMAFEASATIITTVLVGNYIEQKAVTQATTAIESLANLAPESARRLSTSGSVEDITPDQLQVGDRIIIAQGERVPSDATILEGSGYFDESVITGESVAVHKKTGDRIFTGTIVTEGSLTATVYAQADDTILASMVKLAQEAVTRRPKIHRIADKVSQFVIPVVILVAALSFGISYAFFDLSLSEAVLRAVAVLVITCPCAIGLATPLAVAVGVGKASACGAMVRGGDTLEALSEIETIVFDKTGTITSSMGNNSTSSVSLIVRNPAEQDQIENSVVGLESRSSHPIAKAVLNSIKAKAPLSFLTAKEETGVGMHGISSDKIRWSIVRNQRDNGRTILILRNDTECGRLILNESLRPEAKEVIKNLRSLSLTPVLASGDSPERVAEIAQQLSIDAYHSRLLPADKVSLVESLQAKAPTAMIGDGVNDAAAISIASLGIAVGGATASARSAAHVVILGDSLKPLPELVSIAKRTVITIKQNLAWAFLYNIVTIPLAAFGYVPAGIAALTMVVSDIVVIGNSLRFKMQGKRF